MRRKILNLTDSLFCVVHHIPHTALLLFSNALSFNSISSCLCQPLFLCFPFQVVLSTTFSMLSICFCKPLFLCFTYTVFRASTFFYYAKCFKIFKSNISALDLSISFANNVNITKPFTIALSFLKKNNFQLPCIRRLTSTKYCYFHEGSAHCHN